MEPHAAVWRDNLKQQIRGIKSQLDSYYHQRDDEIAEEIEERLHQLKFCFAEERTPPEIERVRQALHGYRNSGDNFSHFKKLMQDADLIDNVARFADEEDAVPSLDEIFDRHKSDETLVDLVDQLIELVERFLEESDAEISARLSRDLQTILDNLRKRSTLSLLELQAWLDLAAGTLITVVETQTGVPGLKLAYDGAKIAFRAKKNLVEAYVEARAELIAQHKIKSGVEALQKCDRIQTEEDFTAALPEPPPDADALEGG